MRFKVGDRVIFLGEREGVVVKGDYYNRELGKDAVDVRRDDNLQGAGVNNSYMFCATDLKLITNSNTNTMRKRYQLLKDSYDMKKGAIYEEECEDGTQPFRLITKEFYKFSPGSTNIISDRAVVENNPEWFREVKPLYVPADKVEAVEKFLEGKVKKVGRARKLEWKVGAKVELTSPDTRSKWKGFKKIRKGKS